MRSAVVLLALAFTQALEEIKDGETIFIDSSVDPDVTFIYRSPESSPHADFTLTVTLYSATERLKLCVSVGKPATDCQYEESGLRPVVTIPAKEVNKGKTVNVFLLCGKCRFRLTVIRSKSVALKPDKPILIALNRQGKAGILYVRRTEGDLVIVVKSIGRDNAVELASEGLDFSCERRWDGSQMCPLVGKGENFAFNITGTPHSLISIVRTM